MVETFPLNKGVEHNFLDPYTPQQNCIVERSNRTLGGVVRSTLNFANLHLYLWVEYINITYITQNQRIRRLNMTRYETMNGRKPSIYFFNIFGCRWLIKNNCDQLKKFHPKSNEAILFSYSSKYKAFCVLNQHTWIIK